MRRLGRTLLGALATVGVAALGAAPALRAQPAPDLGSEEQRAAGRELYAKWCSQCHGDAGDGRGIAAARLKPAPRDFTAGKYKLRSTPAGALPTDADLKRSIRLGLPGTGMPAFERFNDQQLANLVYYLKSFAPAFADPDRYRAPLELPKPPPFSAESAAAGEQVYQELGCAPCHGPTGRGNGTSAPGQRDDWGQHVRPADLTRPWNFRGGATRADIYRSISTGLYGSPMAGFAGSISPEQMWQLVDFIAGLSDNRTEAPYTDVVTAVGVEDDLDLERGEELFATAPPALIPLVGQIVEPGRAFYPSTDAVEVRAVYNRREIAFLVRWHDMRAETSGRNAPDLAVPAVEEAPVGAGAAAGEEEGFWGEAAAVDEEGGDFWGEAAEPAPAEEGDDFWGEAAAEEPPEESGDFWGEETGAAPAAATTPDTEYSDAVAIQLPLELPQGVVRPYFLFGDAQNAVELLYADLGEIGSGEGRPYVGRGSDGVVAGEGDPPAVRAAYGDDGWTVIFKRARQPATGVGFAEESFVPVAFTVWDGFDRERGNRRALSAWQNLYVRPMERPSPVGPIARASLSVLGLELLLIAWVRWRRKKSAGGASREGAALAGEGATQ